MTETIIVALITMASGVFGAGIGAFVNIKAIEKESRRHLHEEKQACFTQFTSAYYTLKHSLDAALLSDAIPFEAKQNLFTQFQSAYSSTLLVCAQSTLKPLNAFYFQVEQYFFAGSASADLDLAYEATLKAMRDELHA